jgi:hypothetical protein
MDEDDRSRRKNARFGKDHESLSERKAARVKRAMKVIRTKKRRYDDDDEYE